MEVPKMTDDEFQRDVLDHLVVAGLATIEGDSIALTSAGVDYIESILNQEVVEPQKIYALGRLQGLREAEVR
jgi:hypothetical protein